MSHPTETPEAAESRLGNIASLATPLNRTMIADNVKPNLERCWTWLGVSTAAVRRNEHFLLYHELDNTEVITQEIGLKA